MSSEAQTGDVKVIHANMYKIDNPDDPSFPYKLEATFRHGEFMRVTSVMLHGGCERFILRGKTAEALLEVAKGNEWLDHPRLLRITVTGPEGVVEEFPKRG